jgi:hypothetical protein
MPYMRRIRLSLAAVYYLGDGTSGQSAPHARENLIMAWPPDSIDLPALLLLDVPGGAGPLSPCCNPRLGASRRWAATEGTLGRAGWSHPSRQLGRSFGRAGRLPKSDVAPKMTSDCYLLRRGELNLSC